MTSDTRTIGAAGWAVYAGVCLIFGTTFLAIKLGTNAGIPPFLGAGLRFATAGTVLVLLRGRLFGARRPTAGFIGRAAVLGLLIIGLTFACTHWAIQHLASGHIAQIHSSAPIIVAVLAVLLLGKRLRLLHGLGLGAGFAGAVLLVGIATGYSDLAPLGALTTGQTTFPLTAPAVGSLLYLIVFGSIGGHSMYLWLVGNTGPLFASTWLYVSPIIATVVGAAVLSEQVLASNIAGAALVIFGVYIINRAERGG
jgi:drug/metabolite transporter (DMT)-like permease